VRRFVAESAYPVYGSGGLGEEPLTEDLDSPVRPPGRALREVAAAGRHFSGPASALGRVRSRTSMALDLALAQPLHPGRTPRPLWLRPRRPPVRALQHAGFRPPRGRAGLLRGPRARTRSSWVAVGEA